MTERELFEAHINQFVKLSDEDKDMLWSSAKIVEHKKGSIILEQGQLERYVSFLHSGAIRFFQEKDNKEITIDFIFTGEFTTAYSSYISRQPSVFSKQAIEDSVVINFPRESIEALYEKSHKFERLGRLLAEGAYLRRTMQETEILGTTAEQRYLSLMNKDAKMVQQIPVKHMASYLGIQPQSLSRIRAKKHS